MRDYFRRLPPFMRAVNVIGLLLLAASILLNLLLISSWSLFHVPQANNGRSGVLALNLVMLGGSCVSVVGAFNERLRQPDRRWRIPLDSWQSQAVAVAFAATPSLYSLSMTLSPSFDATITFWVVMFGAMCWPLLTMRLLLLGSPRARKRSRHSARQLTRKRNRQVR